ncbi:endolytic transglycosylase MltG [Sulfurimonas aquatica]|uniref:Endolytic murein transglycosylase n=2 Tax=Sulfurimonas aquatica TaxID=2672570 RepID=A0A975B2L7_9BACT|nr:endolytic transglycosylase MltG [Sulfurimonas aquatica]QSZ43091.1 endolytic transglycosylase MltG [Sulfurimonas aquatica]
MKIKKLLIIEYVFEIALIIILSFIYYLNKPIETPKVLYIHKGSINNIITQMKENKYDVNKLDTFVLRAIGLPQSGWIDLTNNINTKADFLYKLTTAKAALQNVTLIPGETTYVFLHQLADKLNLNVKKLQEVFKTLSPIEEGALVPDTYRVPIGITEVELITLLLKVSNEKMQEFSNKVFGTYNQVKWFNYVALASIIQKESANIEEMPLVSSVIHNRLNKGMKLQMDGSLNYGKYSHVKITAKRIKTDTSQYNTYLHKGIPKIPVCNVSFDAIRAAIFPTKSNYLYFVKSKSNTHEFSCNYSTHLKNISDTKRNK